MWKKILLSFLFFICLTLLFGESLSSLKKKAVNLVEKGIVYLKANGNDITFKKINDPKGEFTEGELYLFVFDFEGNCLAHGGNLALVGKNHLSLKDTDGKFFIKEMLDLAKSKGSGWVDYKWSNPLKKKIQPKATYVKKVDGMNMFIACGFYK